MNSNLRSCLIAERRRVTRCQLNEERAVFFTSSAFPIYIPDSSNLSRYECPPFNLNNLIGVGGGERWRLAARCERASRHMFTKSQPRFKSSRQHHQRRVKSFGFGLGAAGSNCLDEPEKKRERKSCNPFISN